jgi:hypothetical protein
MFCTAVACLVAFFVASVCEAQFVLSFYVLRELVPPDSGSSLGRAPSSQVASELLTADAMQDLAGDPLGPDPGGGPVSDSLQWFAWQDSTSGCIVCRMPLTAMPLMIPLPVPVRFGMVLTKGITSILCEERWNEA